MSANHFLEHSPTSTDVTKSNVRMSRRCSSPTVDDLASSGWSLTSFPSDGELNNMIRSTSVVPVTPPSRKSPHSSPHSSSIIRCDLCDFSTTRIENMVRHQKQHSAEKRATEEASCADDNTVLSSCRRLFPTNASLSSLPQQTEDNNRTRRKRLAAEMADIRNKVLVESDDNINCVNGALSEALPKKCRKDCIMPQIEKSETNYKIVVEPKVRRRGRGCMCAGKSTNRKSSRRQTKKSKKLDKQQRRQELPSMEDDSDHDNNEKRRSDQQLGSVNSMASLSSTNGETHSADHGMPNTIRLTLNQNGTCDIMHPVDQPAGMVSGMISADDRGHSSDLMCDIMSGTSADWSSGSSCEDDLPDVLTPSQQDRIEVGDILWVRVNRYPFWPAVVCRVNFKKKVLRKISVCFISRLKQECHKYSLNYNKKNIVMFGGSHDIHENLLSLGHQTKYGKAIQEAAEFVEEYLISRAKGQIQTPPLEYFGLEPQDGEEEDLDSVTSSLDTEPLESTFTATSVMQNNVDGDNLADCDGTLSDGGGSDNMAGIVGDEEQMSDRLKACVDRRRQKAAQIIDECRGEKMRDYLRSIVDGTQPSRRHELFHKRKKTKEETHELEATTFGLIDDQDQQQDLIDIILDHFHNLNLQKNNFSMSLTKYVLQVLFPEAVIRAIQTSQRRTRTAAEELYTRGTQITREEYRAQERQMMSSSMTDEQRAQYERRLARAREKLGVII